MRQRRRRGRRPLPCVRRPCADPRARRGIASPGLRRYPGRLLHPGGRHRARFRGRCARSALERAPALDFAELRRSRGNRCRADTTVFRRGADARSSGARWARCCRPSACVEPPCATRPDSAWPHSCSCATRTARSRWTVCTPDFSYVAGVRPYEPDRGEFHHPVLLLRIRNAGGAARELSPNRSSSCAMPRATRCSSFFRTRGACPRRPRSSRCCRRRQHLFRRADHGTGAPDLNPDASLFGAYGARTCACRRRAAAAAAGTSRGAGPLPARARAARFAAGTSRSSPPLCERRGRDRPGAWPVRVSRDGDRRRAARA